MIRFTVKRLLMMIPILIGVSVLVFGLLSFTPGDPAQIAIGSGATEEQLELFREQNGLNDPLIVQYFNYMLGFVRGNLGVSYQTKLTVGSMIASRVGTTLFLSFSSMFITVIVALLLGIGMAVKQNSVFDNIMRVLTIAFSSMPQFWLAIMLIMLFTVWLGWLPSTGLTSWKHCIMPLICLSVNGITMCARTGRASMLEVLHKDYIKTARAKGFRMDYVIRRHALKNSLLPMITVYGRMVGHCFAGSVVVESIFGINGLGQMMTTGLRQKDIPVVMGSIIITAAIISVANLLTDIAYALVDPRIKARFFKTKTRKRPIGEA